MSGAGVYDVDVETLEGGPLRLAQYRGRVLLIVNVASRCGFTPQYAELEALYRRHRPRGFEVLGFPCNQFGGQEPGTAAEIRSFCSTRYYVTFPVFAKLEVNGPGAHPLYRVLKREAPGMLGSRTIKWNFTKFLVARDGRVVKRYAPRDRPVDLEPDVASLLAEPVPVTREPGPAAPTTE